MTTPKRRVDGIDVKVTLKDPEIRLLTRGWYLWLSVPPFASMVTNGLRVNGTGTCVDDVESDLESWR